MTTKGEYRVGIAFNPSADAMVDKIKRAAADLIDLIDGIDAANGEKARLKALAQTEIESAAMWAVKAATKPEAPAAFDTPQAETKGFDPFIEALRKVVDDDNDPSLRHNKPIMDRALEALRAVGFVTVREDEVRDAIGDIRDGKI